MKAYSHLNQTKNLTNAEYREWFRRERIPRAYTAMVHVGFNCSVLIGLIVGACLMVHNWSLVLIGVFAFTMLFGNFVVWALHRYPLHRRYKLWSFPYQAHTVFHHRYYTSDHITFNDSKDYYAIFFPSAVVAGFALFAEPAFFYLTRPILGPDAAYFFCGCCAFYFLSYEFVHWASHLSDDHPLQKFAWLKYMREHHRIHHNPKLMNKYNFCIVYPLMDFLMGTKYKEAALPQDNAEDHFLNVMSNVGE